MNYKPSKKAEKLSQNYDVLLEIMIDILAAIVKMEITCFSNISSFGFYQEGSHPYPARALGLSSLGL